MFLTQEFPEDAPLYLFMRDLAEASDLLEQPRYLEVRAPVAQL